MFPLTDLFYINDVNRLALKRYKSIVYQYIMLGALQISNRGITGWILNSKNKGLMTIEYKYFRDDFVKSQSN